MIYVQFFHTDLAGKLAEATGDRSVVVLDGRQRNVEHELIAIYECKRRGYEAWQLFIGDSFTRSLPLGKVERLT